MADGSSTGSGGEYYAAAAVNSAAIEQSMAKASQHIVNAAQQLSTFSAETLKIKKEFQDIGSQAILNPEILTTSKEFEESALRIVNQYGKLNKHTGAILRLNTQIKKLEHDIATDKTKQTTQSKSLLENMKKISKEYEKGVKSQSKHGSAWDKTIKTVQRYGSAVTGLNISFMGLVAMIVDIANLTRKIDAYAAMGAAHLGDGAKAVYQTRSAMFDLRRGFAVTYDEAGKIVGQLEAMGFTGEQIARKGPMLKSLRAEKKQLIENMASYEDILDSAIKGNIEAHGIESAWEIAERTLKANNKEVRAYVSGEKELANKAKEIADNNEKARKAAKLQVSTTQELYAIQRKYGIDISRSGGIIKSLQQDFGASNKQARGLLGTAISLGTSLQTGGMRVGISELLQDWGQLIEGTKVYKTDLLGILGLYNVMIGKADKLGLEGVAKSVRMDIAKTLTSPLKMEFGWKAGIGMRAGLGRSPAEAGIKFEEKMVKKPLEAFKIIVGEVTKMVGNPKTHPYEAQYRGRMLFGKLGFSQESSKVLAEKIVQGNLTDKKIQEQINAQWNEDKKMNDLRKAWEKNRNELVTSAGTIAKHQIDYQQQLRRWIEDKLMGPLLNIYDTLQSLYAWFAGGSAAASLGYKNFGENIKDIMGTKKEIKGREFAGKALSVFQNAGIDVAPKMSYLERAAVTVGQHSNDPEAKRKANQTLDLGMERAATELTMKAFKSYKERYAGTYKFQQLQNLMEGTTKDKAISIVVDAFIKEQKRQTLSRKKEIGKQGVGTNFTPLTP